MTAILRTYLVNINDKDALNLEALYLKECVECAVKGAFFDESELGRISIECDANYKITADKVILKQVIVNLLKNAMAAISSSDIKKIRISAYLDGADVVLSIKDTGCGIKEENLAKIFTPFYTTKSTGIGIGLAFCRSMLEKMGAAIMCESVVGEYAEFLLVFMASK